MRLLFVINPVSGGVDKQEFIEEASAMCHKYGVIFEIFHTTGGDDIESIKNVANTFKPDKTVSVGGDGTLLITAQALFKSNIPIGIIPLGSANGMSVELSVPPDPIEALKDIIMSNIIAGLDMVVVNNKHYSIHLGDVGINANIVEAYEKDENRGMVTYAKYFIEKFYHTEPFDYKIETNGKTVLGKAIMVGICNGRKYGTGVPLNVTGNPMDGKFEIVTVENINITSLIKAGLAKFDERFYDSQAGKLISTDKAIIEFDKERLLQLDGEVIGKFKKLEIKILKSAVNFITTKENRYLH